MENIREYTGFDDTNVTVVRIEGEGSINTYVVPMFYLINVLVFIQMTNLILFLERVYRFGAFVEISVTEMNVMNQMDGTTGPPPMAKEKIAQIPTVSIDQQQVGQFDKFVFFTSTRRIF